MIAETERPGRPGVALAALAGATFIGVATESLPIGLLRAISDDLATPESTVGLAVTVYAFVVALTAVPLTALTIRTRRKQLLISLLLAYAASNALAGLSPSFGVLLGARVLGGMCHGVFWSIIAGYAARLVGPGEEAMATSRVFVGNALALAVGVPAGTAVGNAVGWRTAFYLGAALTLALAAATWRVVPAVAATPNATTRDDVRPSMRRALARPGLRMARRPLR